MIGIDITSISRIVHLCNRFGTETVANRFLSELELAQPITMKLIASRWAAKEAISKAIGTGISSHCQLKEISILNDTNGKPYVTFIGATGEYVSGKTFHISISHEEEYAVAVCISIPNALNHYL